MADIEGLKQRIELIDLRLKTAHSARERESAALIEMWGQIRDRFHSQKAEIVALRDRVRLLEDTRDDLQGMVDNLLGAVEGGLERMADETVSKIRELASDLLNETEPSAPFPLDTGDDTQTGHALDFVAAEPDSSDPYEESDASGKSDDDDFLTALERSVNATTIPTGNAETDSDDALVLDTPVSPGIRDLIARIHDSIGERVDDAGDAGNAGSSDTAQSPDALGDDLLEIEQLRNELLGLRDRISDSKR